MEFSIGKVIIQFMRPKYYTIKPSARLSGVVHHFWITESSFDSECLSSKQTCIPLGMVEWIIQTKGDHQLGLFGNSWQTFPKDYVVGITSKPVHWKMFGESKVIGICIRPEWFSKIYNFPLRSLTDGFLEIEALDNPELTSLREALIEEDDDVNMQIEIIESFLMKMIERHSEEESYFYSTIDRIRTSVGSFDTKTLSDHFYLGDRQIQRLFKQNFGLSPKAYDRLTRFSNTVKQIGRYSHPRWNELADEFGYADQAHLIREFKNYAGFTPTSSFVGDSTVLFVPVD